MVYRLKKLSGFLERARLCQVGWALFRYDLRLYKKMAMGKYRDTGRVPREDGGLE